MPEILDLAKLEEPKYKFKLPDGTERAIDPWKATNDILVAESNSPVSTDYDAVRVAFGFPTEAKALADARAEGAAEDAPLNGDKFRTLTCSQAAAMRVNLFEFTADLQVSKKGRELAKKLNR